MQGNFLLKVSSAIDRGEEFMWKMPATGARVPSQPGAGDSRCLCSVYTPPLEAVTRLGPLPTAGSFTLSLKVLQEGLGC